MERDWEKLRQYYRECGERMHQRRAELEMSMDTLAMMTGLDIGVLVDLESGDWPWNYVCGSRVADALGRSDEWLRPDASKLFGIE